MLAPCKEVSASGGWSMNHSMQHIQSTTTVPCTVVQQKGENCFLCFDGAQGGEAPLLYDCKRYASKVGTAAEKTLSVCMDADFSLLSSLC